MIQGSNNSKYIIFLFLFCCIGWTVAQKPKEFIDQADFFYNSKKFQKAGELYKRAFEFDQSEYRSENLYNASCAYALAGDNSKAIECLETAVNFGWKDFDRANSDSDLNSIKHDARFKLLEEKIRIKFSENSKVYFWGMYLGILFILFFYNLFLFFSLKEISLLFYVILIFLYSQFESVRTPSFGYFAQDIFIWQRYFQLLGNSGNFLICLTMVFQLLFTSSFLNLKQHYPVLNKIFKLLEVFFAAMCLFILLNKTLPLRGVIYTFTLLSCVFLLSIGIYCWQERHRSARFFVLANLAYILGVVIVLLKSLNLLDIYFKISVFRPDNLGQMAFFTLLSFAVGDKINLLKKEKAEAQEKALEILEEKVKERTAEVVSQKHLIEEKHKEITDSINYAERIQKSFIATKDLLDDNLKDYFVFFQPKDVVSGDFYWANKLSNGQFALVTADSTGHGVPGAIMSLLNITSLERAIETSSEPSQILNITRQIIIERLKKDGSTDGGKDGMDCSLISFNFKNNKLTYSAANNPIWLVRNTELLEFAPDKMPVGKHDKDNTPFTQKDIELQKGDVIYAITDGMPDQFGGVIGKKYKHKQLKELFVSISKQTMYDQKVAIFKALSDWKGNLEQVDDITIIGVRV